MSFPRTVAGATVAAAWVLTACSADDAGAGADRATVADEAGADAVLVEIRPVALSAAAPVASEALPEDEDGIAEVLTGLAIDVTAGGLEAAAWFADGDCAAQPWVADAVAAGCSTDGTEVFLLGATALDGGTIVDAQLDEDTDSGDTLTLTFDKDGTQALADLTARAVAQPAPANRIAIVVDGTVVSSPAVMAQLTDGEVVVAGGPGGADVRALAEALG